MNRRKFIQDAALVTLGAGLNLKSNDNRFSFSLDELSNLSQETKEYPQDLINVPQSGGALKGINDNLKPNLFTGSINYTVPINRSPGRNGFEPPLVLNYSMI